MSGAVPGGVLIIKAGHVVGAVGISGDTSGQLLLLLFVGRCCWQCCGCCQGHAAVVANKAIRLVLLLLLL